MNKRISWVLLALLAAGKVTAQPLSDWAPVTLEPDTTHIYVEDLFVSKADLLQVKGPAWLQVQHKPGAAQVLITSIGNDIPALSVLELQTHQQTYHLIVNRSQRKQVEVQFDPHGVNYSQVGLAGDMNGWNAAQQPFRFVNGKWVTTLFLLPGRYPYQIRAGDETFLDPNADTIPNGMGGYNSLLLVDGPDREKRPFIYYEAQTDHKISIGFDRLSESDIVLMLWQNQLLPVDFGATVRTVLPDAAQAVPQSYLRVYAANEEGTANDLLIPLSLGEVVVNPNQIDRHDFHKSIVYFLLVDRFYNGDPTNDKPVADDRLDVRANYQGGDLAGVMKKLEDGYFTNLGFNTLWLSPVFQNPLTAYQEYPPPHRWFSGYHGYWPVSLSKVDTRFGSNEQFKALADSLHSKDMNLIFDYIANHVHAEHPLWESNPEWFSSLNLPDGRKNLRLWDEQRLTTWFEPYMPSLDHSKPEVAAASADSAIWWLKQYGIDGFRHDATKHIETSFWRLLTRKIRMEYMAAGGHPVYQVGETFGNRELIGSYVGNGLLDAQFDFNLFFDARQVLAAEGTSFKDLSASLHHSFDYYGYHHLMGNISGNHDLPRFISYAGEGLKWDENEKEAGWQRNIQVENRVGYQRLALLHAFIMTIPGIPMVYYGDEIGMPGAGDPDNRRMMQFQGLSTEEQQVKVQLRQLAKTRSQHMALLYGDFQELLVTDDVWVYLRIFGNDRVLVGLNKGSQEVQLPISLTETLAGFQVTGQQGGGQQQNQTVSAVEMLLTIPAYSYTLLVEEK